MNFKRIFCCFLALILVCLVGCTKVNEETFMSVEAVETTTANTVETTEIIIEPTIAPTEPTEATEVYVELEATTATEEVDISKVDTIFITPIDEFEDEWEEEIIHLAKTIWGEARGLDAEGWEKVAWCVLNRVDDPRFDNDIISVVTAPYQFHGYKEEYSYTKEMYLVALKTIWLWQVEKTGMTVKRLLEPEYVYFSANAQGTENVYRTEF